MHEENFEQIARERTAQDAERSSKIEMAINDLFQAMNSEDKRQLDEAWRRIYELTLYQVERSIQSVTAGLPKEKTQEIVQDVFQRAYQGFGAFDKNHPEVFLPWLKSIAKRRAIDYLRENVRTRSGYNRREIPLEEEKISLLEGENIFGHQAATPEELIIEKEEHLSKKFLRTFPRLTDKEQAAVILREIMEIPGKDAGRVLGVSEARVSQLISGAKEKMRQPLKTLREEKAMSQEEYNDLVDRWRQQAKETLGELPTKWKAAA